MFKKRKKKTNNSYKLPDQVAIDILGLNNKELISRVTLEYANWTASVTLKKEDPKLKAISTQLKELEDEVKDVDEVMELEYKLKELKESLSSEKVSTYKEEKKNLLEPYNEDIKFFKICFQLSMDEINRRKKEGLLSIEGKIV